MKNSIFLLGIVLSIVTSSICSGQPAALQAYPELHLANIRSIDTDDFGKNALSLSIGNGRDGGRTIFWDLETSRPLRIWKFNGIGHLTKIIIDEEVGISLIEDKKKNFHFVYYNLETGIEYKKFSIERNFKLDLIDSDFDESSERKPNVILLFKDSLRCVSLYNPKVKWNVISPPNAKQVYYLNKDTILVYTDDEVLYIDIEQETKEFKPFNTEKITDFKRENVKGLYHFTEDNGYINVAPLDPNSDNSFRFKNTVGIKIESIHKITGNAYYSFLQMNLKDEERSELAFINHKKEEIVWHEKFIAEKGSIGILESAVASKALEIVYSDPTRKIKIIDGFTGKLKFIDKSTGKEEYAIENNETASKTTFITPDFKHMIYSLTGLGDNGQPNGDKKATYYIDLSNPSYTQLLFEDVALKIQVTKKDNNRLLILNPEGLVEFDVENKIFYPGTLTFPFPIIGKISDMEYDTLSGRMLIKSKNAAQREKIEVDNNEVESLIEDGVKVGIKYRGFQLYGKLIPGDTVSKFIFDQNVTLVYEKDNRISWASIYKKDGDFRSTFVAGGKYVIMKGVGDSRPEMYLYDVDNKKYINPYKGANIVGIEKDLYSDLVLFNYDDKTCVLVKTNDFKEVKRFKLEADPLIMVLNSKLGTIIYSDFNNGKKLFFYNYENGDTEYLDSVNCTAFQDLSSDGRYLALSNYKEIEIINVEECTKLIREKGFIHDADFVKFSQRKNMAISGRLNGRLNFWNLDANRVSATFMINPEGEYLIYDEIGNFDCLSEVKDEIYYSVQKETMDLDQLEKKFWNENMLTKKMDNEAYNFNEEKLNKMIYLYPGVKLSTSENQDTLFIELKENYGGIGRVDFYINGTRIENVNPDTLEKISIPLSKYEDKFIPKKPNILGVIVFNNPNKGALLKSKQKRIPIMFGQKQSDNPFLIDSNEKDIGEEESSKGGLDLLTKARQAREAKKAATQQVDIKKTRLIGLVVGTSDYNGSDNDLDYADIDANSIEKALLKTGKSFYDQYKQDDKEKVIIHKLTSKSSDSTLTSTKNNIIDKMKEIQDIVTHNDILVLFFSGHGFSHDEEYYYATKDATASTLSGEDSLLKSRTISSEEIYDFFNESKSLNKLLILDACYSGAYSDAIKKRNTLNEIGEENAVYIFSSSTASQKSFEMKALGHGVLTYCLLAGMSGNAPAANEPIHVHNLGVYVKRTVIEKADSRQDAIYERPPDYKEPFKIGLSDNSIAPAGSKFPIGKACIEDVEFNLLESLNNAIDKEIEDKSRPEDDAPFMFYDGGNSIKIRGRKIKSDDVIELSVFFSKPGLETCACKNNPISGSTEKEIAKKIVDELKEFLKNKPADCDIFKKK